MVVRFCGTSFFTVSAALQHLRGVFQNYYNFFCSPTSNAASVLCLGMLTVTGWWRQNNQAMENGDARLRRGRGATQHYSGQGMISGRLLWNIPPVIVKIILVKMIVVPLQTVFTGLDHHQNSGVFATCGQQVDIWDEQRSSPIRSFTWGVDSFSAVRFNPVEVRHHVSATLRWVSSVKNTLPLTICPCPNSHIKKWLLYYWIYLTVYVFPQTELLASCASDRSIVMYDMRESAPLKKVGSTTQFFSLPISSQWLDRIYIYCVFSFSCIGYYDNEEQHIMLEPYGSLLLHMFKWGLQVSWGCWWTINAWSHHRFTDVPSTTAQFY